MAPDSMHMAFHAAGNVLKAFLPASGGGKYCKYRINYPLREHSLHVRGQGTTRTGAVAMLARVSFSLIYFLTRISAKPDTISFFY